MSDVVKTFEEIRATVYDDVPKPKSLPQGWWKLRVRGASMAPPSEVGKKTRVTFGYEPVEPIEGVNPADVEALGDNYSVRDNRVWKRFWLGDNRDINELRAHLEKHDVDLTGMSIPDSLKAVANHDIEGFVKQTTRTDPVRGSVTEDEIVSFRPVRQS